MVVLCTREDLTVVVVACCTIGYYTWGEAVGIVDGHCIEAGLVGVTRIVVVANNHVLEELGYVHSYDAVLKVVPRRKEGYGAVGREVSWCRWCSDELLSGQEVVGMRALHVG